MRELFDAGALIALDRGDIATWQAFRAIRSEGRRARTHGGVIGQVWRDGSRQARLSKAISALDVAGLDEQLGRSAGDLLRRSGTTDVVDAALVAMAGDGDVIYTSDVDDIKHLAEAKGVHVGIVRV